MKQLAVEMHLSTRVASTEPQRGFLRGLGLGWLVLLVIAMTAPFGAHAQLTGTGAISGTVTDSTGAVVGNATVTAMSVDTNENTIRTTTGAGDYNITPLLPGKYIIPVEAFGI